MLSYFYSLVFGSWFARVRQGANMRYNLEQIVSRIGEKGYLEIVAVFLSLGFKNVNDVPDDLWNIAVHSYEEKLFRQAA
jgi:hypothetical protein